MTFTVLSPVLAWTLLAITGLVVVAFYLLRPQPARIVVPSTVLWRRVLERRRNHRERLRWLLSLLLSLLIAAAIAVAVAGPELGDETARRRITVILDNSPSMSARTDDGRQRWDHARDAARELIEAVGTDGRVLLADTAGQLSTLVAEAPRDAIDRLATLEVSHRPARLPELVSQDGDTYFITDGVALGPGPTRARTISVFEPADNVGISRFGLGEGRSTPVGSAALLELVNTGHRTTATLELTDGVGGRIEHTVDLAPDSSWSDVLDLEPLEPGEIRARVTSSNDGFGLDDTAYLYRPPAPPLRVLLVTDGNRYLETALDLQPTIESTVLTPEDYDAGSLPEMHLVIFDRFAPANAPAVPALLFRPQPTPWLAVGPAAMTSPRPRVPDDRHPLLEGIDVRALSVNSAVQLVGDVGGDAEIVGGDAEIVGQDAEIVGQDAEIAGGDAEIAGRDAEIAGEDAEIVLDSDQGPLIVLEDGPGSARLIVAFGLEPADSRLALMPAFQVFLDNAIHLLCRRLPEPSHLVGTVELPWPAAVIRDPDGGVLDTVHLAHTTLFDAPRSGIYTADVGDRRHHVVVNHDGGIPAINRSTLGPDSPPVVTPSLETRSPTRDPIPFLLAGALALGLVEWWTYLRRLTV